MKKDDRRSTSHPFSSGPLIPGENYDHIPLFAGATPTQFRSTFWDAMGYRLGYRLGYRMGCRMRYQMGYRMGCRMGYLLEYQDRGRILQCRPDQRPGHLIPTGKSRSAISLSHRGRTLGCHPVLGVLDGDKH